MQTDCRKSDQRPTVLIAHLLIIAICLQFGCRQRDLGDNKNDSSNTNGRRNVRVGKIDGASMAPRLRGVHCSAECPKCQHEFDWNAVEPSKARKIYCPLCGGCFDEKENAVLKAADQIEIIELDKSFSPKKWSIVAFRQGDHYSVKRIVGLPGESITIRHGDVYINERPCTKPVEVQKAIRILLFDSNHQIDRQLVFEPEVDNKIFPLVLNSGSSIGFQQYPNYQTRVPDQPQPIKDYYGYNQGLTRSLNQCHDIGCELEIEIDKNELAACKTKLFAKIYGWVEFEVSIDQQVVNFAIRQNKKTILTGEKLLSGDGREQVLFASIIDGKARIDFGEKSDVNCSASLALLPQELAAEPDCYVSVHVPELDRVDKNASISLKRLNVYRDLHYFEKVPRGSRQLADDEYFVIGDNVPVSRDSRNSGILPRRADLIGTVTRKP